MTSCVITTPPGQRCVSCPEVPAITAVPAQTIVETIYGWNGSAHSVAQLGSDVFTEFTAAASVGVVCGLAPEHVSSDPRDVPYGFYCYQDSGRFLWAVAESGQPVTTPAAWVPDVDVFRIERRGGTVSYFVNSRRGHVSAVGSLAPLRVVCCMYASGDGVY